jgi:predicted metalloprotease with PDZ domain
VSKLMKLVPEHIKVFGELPKFDHGQYTFIADYMPQITGDGMEHRNSTFISQPRSLFRANFAQLGTASHEFFHAWNVERIRPAELEPFDFTKANPTPSLWLAEGFTQYYGPLLIRRSGQSTTDEFLTGLSGTLNGVVTGPGRLYGSPQEMSLRAPFVDAAAALDPTNPNIFTSYYPYGAIVGLALDLQLRGRAKPLSLDDFMKRMWKQPRRAREALQARRHPRRPGRDDRRPGLRRRVLQGQHRGFGPARLRPAARPGRPEAAPEIAQEGLAGRGPREGQRRRADRRRPAGTQQPALRRRRRARRPHRQHRPLRVRQ